MTDHPKTLEEILRNNPEARTYWQEVAQNIGARHDALEEAKIDCPTCGGNGYVRVGNLPPGHPKFGQLFPCPDPACPVRAKQQHERYEKLCTRAQIPAGYQELTFTEWQNLNDYPAYLEGKQDALGAALAFVAARDQGYLFTLDDAAAAANLPAPEMVSGQRCSIAYYGPPGVGKTSLAVSIARALLDENCGVVYIQLMEFFDALKKTFSNDADEEEDEVLKRYQQAPVLILDEFGIQTTDWRKERAYDLVNYRYAHRLPTVITTNYTSEVLISKWGLQIGHRLQAMAHWLEVGGLELRQRNAMVKSR